MNHDLESDAIAKTDFIDYFYEKKFPIMSHFEMSKNPDNFQYRNQGSARKSDNDNSFRTDQNRDNDNENQGSVVVPTLDRNECECSGAKPFVYFYSFTLTVLLIYMLKRKGLVFCTKARLQS